MPGSFNFFKQDKDGRRKFYTIGLPLIPLIFFAMILAFAIMAYVRSLF